MSTEPTRRGRLSPRRRPADGNGSGNGRGRTATLDEPVDLGSAADAADGESLALRRHAEHAGGGVGLPTIETPTPQEIEPPEDESYLAKLRRTLRGYAELRRTPYGLTPVLLLATLGFLGQLDDSAFLYSRPEIVEDLEVEILSLINVSVYVGVVVTFLTLLVGWYMDRHIRAPWLGIGAITGGVMGMAASRATTLFTLGLPRTVSSSFAEVANVPRLSLYADYYPPEVRGRVFALSGMMSRLGSVIGLLGVGISIDQFGWRTTTFMFSAPLIPVGILAIIRLREPVRGYMERRALGADEAIARTEDEPQSFGEAWRGTFAVRTLRRLFIADCITLSGDTIVTLYFAFFLFEEYGLRGSELTYFILPRVIATILASSYGGVLIDRFARKNPRQVLFVLGGYTVISGIATIGYIFQPPLAVLILFSVMFGIGSGLIGPANSVVYSQVLPANIRTQGLQVQNLALLPGLIVFSPVAGSLFGEYGYGTVFGFATPLIVLGGFVAMSAGSFFDLDARSAFAASLANEEWRRAKASGKGKLLVCRDVDVQYSGVQVLFGVDFDVEEGEIIALLGTNGAGKSTLLRAISGTSEASGGAIVFDGRDITHMPPHEVTARGVIHMPGGRGVFPGLTVRENLMLANWLTEDPEEIRQRMEEVANIFPILRERADTIATNLSGGEQQQLSLAQAFLAKPRLLMIDELSLGLSPAIVGELLEIVREIHRRGVTIIVVEQSVNIALTLAEKAIFMEKGEVKFFGRTSELLDRPDILRAIYVKGTGALSDAPSGASRRRTQELESARPILQVDNLVKRYGGVTAVDGVSFDLRDGEVLGLIGPNGAGKTTIFDLISGFQIPDEGRVVFEGVDVTNVAPEERARRKLIRRFQDARLFPALTVYETLLVALEHRLEVKSAILNAAAMPQARRAERRLRVRAERLIELLDLGSYRDKFVKELSTGLRRIVDLACVLATEPRLLLLDEPSSGIAQAEAEGLAPLLRRVRHETGCSILIIEHDMPLISAVSDELLALERGKYLVRGTPADVLNDERVIESYLGSTEATVKRSGSIDL